MNVKAGRKIRCLTFEKIKLFYTRTEWKLN